MKVMEMAILFIQMGGTIDKNYPKTKSGYNFEIGPPAFEQILTKIRPTLGFKAKIKKDLKIVMSVQYLINEMKEIFDFAASILNP